MRVTGASSDTVNGANVAISTSNVTVREGEQGASGERAASKAEAPGEEADLYAFELIPVVQLLDTDTLRVTDEMGRNIDGISITHPDSQSDNDYFTTAR